MNTEFETLLEKGKEVHLSEQEKSEMKAVLITFAQNHPVRNLEQLPWYTYFRSHIALTAFTLLIFMTGGGSAFAEKSFPGDVLYSVKTGVNEQVLGLFAVSSQSKAEWQLTLADRRLQEVEHVALTQNNSEETKNLLIAQVDIHLKNASEESQKDDMESAPISENESPLVQVKKEAPSITTSQVSESDNTSAMMMTTAVVDDTARTSTLVDNDTIQKEKASSTLDGAIEQLRLAREKVNQVLGQDENKKSKIQAGIELIQARREFFEQKDKESKKTISDLTQIIDTEISNIEKLNSETELNTNE